MPCRAEPLASIRPYVRLASALPHNKTCSWLARKKSVDVSRSQQRERYKRSASDCFALAGSSSQQDAALCRRRSGGPAHPPRSRFQALEMWSQACMMPGERSSPHAGSHRRQLQVAGKQLHPRSVTEASSSPRRQRLRLDDCSLECTRVYVASLCRLNRRDYLHGSCDPM